MTTIRKALNTIEGYKARIAELEEEKNKGFVVRNKEIDNLIYGYEIMISDLLIEL